MSTVKGFGARGDGKTDDTDAIIHAIRDGDGSVRFPAGSYRISRTIEISLNATGPICIDGNGTARIIMSGPGPAFRLVGTHGGTGHPTSIKDAVWPQCLPTLKNIVIEGLHPEADGVELIETMQAVFEGLLIRRVRHGIRLHKRNRNVLISHCHIYFNTGVGILLEGVNLHQINIASNHISYNRLGGIRISASEVRNLQITGNDIEYNTHAVHKTAPERTAEILIDTTADGASVNEVTVASNTIQATPTPDGANIRIIERRDSGRPPGLWSITGNIIGSQTHNIHLLGCHGIVISGNCIYSCGVRNLLIEDSDHITIGANSFRRHTPAMNTGIRIANSANCTLTGCTLQDEAPEGQKTKASLLEVVDSQRITITGCLFLDGAPYGVDLNGCSFVNMTGCTVMDTREAQKAQGMLRIRGAGKANLLVGNTIGKCAAEALEIEPAANVTLAANVLETA
jgi:polygalacturonase